MDFLFVALGGAAGAVSRYALSLVNVKLDFPLMTFITNIAGSFLIGLIASLCIKKACPKNLTLLLKTGFCGGFTTFSTFSLESFTLIQSGNYFTAVLYMILSVIFCVLGAALGTFAVR